MMQLFVLGGSWFGCFCDLCYTAMCLFRYIFFHAVLEMELLLNLISSA